MSERKLKVEKPVKKTFCKVEAIRVYLPELMKEINQCTERDEYPNLLVKSTVRSKTKAKEIELVFMGTPMDRHIETLNYYKKPPSQWITWGEIVLSPSQALDLANNLLLLLKDE